jgi:hypothetical protein
MKRRLSAVLIALVGCLSCGAQWVGIPAGVVNGFAVSQWQSEWCWAASAQLILNLYGIPVTQADLVARSHGNLGNNPGSDMDILAVLNGWVPAAGGSRTVHATEFPGLLAPQLIINNLTSGHPILIAIASGPASGHAVVITAAAFVQTPQGPLLSGLVIRDPWPSPDHMQSIGRVVIQGPDLIQFIAGIRASWISWVT